MDVTSPAQPDNWKFKTGSKYRARPDNQHLLSRLISSIVRMSLSRLIAEAYPRPAGTDHVESATGRGLHSCRTSGA